LTLADASSDLTGRSIRSTRRSRFWASGEPTATNWSRAANWKRSTLPRERRSSPRQPRRGCSISVASWPLFGTIESYHGIAHAYREAGNNLALGAGGEAYRARSGVSAGKCVSSRFQGPQVRIAAMVGRSQSRREQAPDWRQREGLGAPTLRQPAPSWSVSKFKVACVHRVDVLSHHRRIVALRAIAWVSDVASTRIRRKTAAVGTRLVGIMAARLESLASSHGAKRCAGLGKVSSVSTSRSRKSVRSGICCPV
jgi:hypothetical protein